MPYPIIYDVTYSYTGFQQAQGDNSFPGTQIDADLAGLQASIESYAAFTQGVMRSDGALQNGSVTYDSLSPGLQTAGIAPATAWVTAHSYALNVSVVQTSSLYRCIVAHTSGVFATDLAAGKWLFIGSMPTGATGPGATVAAGSVTTLGAGAAATVVNVGTSQAATFNFGIPQGVQGATGPTGAGYGGTSATSLLIANSTTKVFTTQAGMAYQVGAYVRASSAANGSNFMEGLVSAYAGTSLSIAVSNIGGSGTFADWGFTASGVPGAAGVGSLNGQTGALVFPIVPSARLTLTSGVAFTESDVTGAATVYVTPVSHDRTAIYDGTNDVPFLRAEIALVLNNPNHASGKMYDVFEAVSGGVAVAGTGPDWTAGTAGTINSRGTGAGSTEIESFHGRAVNKNSITLRNGATTYSIGARQANLVGTFFTTGIAQTEDSFVKRFVSSVYEPAIKMLKRIEATDSWAYSTATFRQANASTSNQVEYISTLSGRALKADVVVVANTSAGNQHPVVAVGIDSVTVDSSTLKWCGTPNTTTGIVPIMANYRGHPGLGYHKVVWLEKGAGADTQTFFGDGGDPTTFQSGLVAEILQ